MAYPRNLLVPPDTSGCYHCVSRCVRRAFLCGEDRHSGRSFEHRKGWVKQRLQELSALFSIALYGYAVMSNHVHVVVRVDVETAQQWTERDVAERWCRLFPQKNDDFNAFEQRVARLIENAAKLTLCRERLVSLSWFMRCLNESIARRANSEDDCTGRFWEGRYKCQALLDERALVAAMVYVDLNPIRAGMTTRLDRSDHTSVQQRLIAARKAPSTLSKPLRPVAGAVSGMRLRLTTADYIDLVDWTGRQLRPDKRGAIPAGAPRALARLGLAPELWTQHVQGIDSGYWRVVGAFHALIEKAAEMGQRWLKGLGLARQLA